MKVGIITDNYKLKQFEKELTKKGFIDFEVEPFKDKTSTIKVEVPENEVGGIKKICEFVELFFKHKN